MSEWDVVLQHGRALLRQAREAGASWPGLPMQLIDDGSKDVRDVRDVRELDRRQLAWAMQYAFDGESRIDAALARTLLDQEAQWRRRDPHQGIGDTLEIACHLVGQARDASDVWRLCAAKTANFDTSLGLDREALYSGGVEATLAYVRASAHPERARVLAELADDQGRPLIDVEQHAQWLASRATYFAADPASEPLELWIDRALALGQAAVARALVQRWAQGRHRDEEFLASCAMYHEALGDLSLACDLRGARVAMLPAVSERAGELVRAADLALGARRWVHALEYLEHAALLHAPRPQWRELGLGRELVRVAFALAHHAPPAVAPQAFQLATRLAEHTPRLPPATLELAVSAATRLEQVPLAAHFSRLLEQPAAR